MESESASDSLMASPSSFINCFSCWSTDHPPYLTILGRVVAQQAGRSRTMSALWQAGRSTALSVGRILHLLWLEVTGFVFLCIALIAGLATRHEYVHYRAGAM